MSRYPKGYRKPTDSCDSCLARILAEDADSAG